MLPATHCVATIDTGASGNTMSHHNVKHPTSTPMAAAAAAAFSDKKVDDEEVVGMEVDDSTITVLVGTDRVPFQMSRRICMAMSNVFKTALEQDLSATEIECRQCTPQAFEHIKRYMEYHKVPGHIIPYPAKSKMMVENCKDKWDATFVDQLWDDEKLRATFYDILNAANYIDVRCLLHLLCCKVGTKINGCPFDKLREVLIPPGSGIVPKSQ